MKSFHLIKIFVDIYSKKIDIFFLDLLHQPLRKVYFLESTKFVQFCFNDRFKLSDLFLLYRINLNNFRLTFWCFLVIKLWSVNSLLFFILFIDFILNIFFLGFSLYDLFLRLNEFIGLYLSLFCFKTKSKSLDML